MMRIPPLHVLLALAVMAPLQAATPTALAQGNIAAVWANDGGDKILREERRASAGAVIAPAHGVINAVWDGNRISVFGARNEVVGFNLVIESERGAEGVGVSFDRLEGPGGTVIGSKPTRGDELFDYRGRNIELFHLRYLPIRGLSLMAYELTDERWIPSRMRRPFEVVRHGTAWRAMPVRGKEGFNHRPGAGRHFPEIAVPLEAQPTFAVPANSSQSIWVDIYIPRSAPAGLYKGTLRIREQATPPREVPVELTVRGFTLPDTPSAIAIAALEHYDVAERFLGTEQRFADWGTPAYGRLRPILERHVQMLRRHGVVTMMDEANGVAPPRIDAVARIKGTLYSEAKGYDGPGKNTGDSVFFIAPYGKWAWKKSGQTEFNKHTDAWMAWFAVNAPRTQKILYLVDEPNLKDAAQLSEINGWLDKIQANPGIGARLPTFITSPTELSRQVIPRVTVLANWYSMVDTKPFQAARGEHLKAAPGNQIWQYNGKRPASGSFAIEDDGTALRVVQWAAFKAGIGGWFNWNATYYNDYQSGAGRNDVWRRAKTFGQPPRVDVVLGETSSTYSNGDGVLLYPGIDRYFPDAPTPGLNGPVASLRLKLWRRGIQDADYLTLAMSKDPAATKALVDRMVPKVMSEVGVYNPRDPTYQFGGQGDGIGWSINPDDWEAARRKLADIIEKP